LNNLMTLIICESLREIGEVACVTSAWSSRGQTLNRSTSVSFFLVGLGFSSNVLGSKPTAFKKPFAAPFFTACHKPDLPLPSPTLVSFFRMGIREVVGFLCMISVGGKRHFFFADTVPKVGGETIVAFRFSFVSSL